MLLQRSEFTVTKHVKQCIMCMISCIAIHVILCKFSVDKKKKYVLSHKFRQVNDFEIKKNENTLIAVRRL